MLNRRTLLKLLIGTALLGTAASVSMTPAYAKDGGQGSDGDGGHDDNGGHDDDGGHDDNSGGDDNGGDHNQGDDGGHNGKTHSRKDQDDALRQVQDGKIIPLKTALAIAGRKAPGKVIDVRLLSVLGRVQYRLKVRSPGGRISTIRLDARTGAFVGILGF